ncbi:hypothetical protein ACJ73_05131 [Blastomyces percursus]|uniref:Uncharacterized protein n=1 Tax=Blastomyces percursus TaxID=1658174 RepID=A0A1J9R796_9EURO|nr:hypothetical protein ACJ73_05131 [Blastomyces percursus]
MPEPPCRCAEGRLCRAFLRLRKPLPGRYFYCGLWCCR